MATKLLCKHAVIDKNITMRKLFCLAHKAPCDWAMYCPKKHMATNLNQARYCKDFVEEKTETRFSTLPHTDWGYK